MHNPPFQKTRDRIVLGNDKSDDEIFDLQETINTLKARVEFLEKYATEIKKELAFYKDLRESNFGAPT
ncbi:MAG: hypothetical protein Q9175_008079 [Cornicularia normoerica]